MRISIIALGTRGDAQPAIALGKGLQAAGHQVSLLASSNFRAWIESHGLQAASARVDIQAMMNSTGGREWVESGRNAVRQFAQMKALVNDLGFDLATDIYEATREADLVIGSLVADAPMQSIVEKTGQPYLRALLQPLLPTREGYAFPNAALPAMRSWINLRVAYFALGLLWDVYAQSVARLRAEVLGLPPQTTKGYVEALLRFPVINGFSDAVIPRPSDWPESAHTTGFWFLDGDDGWQPPASLRDFLAASPAPICLGFGSMTGSDPAGTTAILVEALKLSGQRAVLLSGWAGVGQGDLPDDIFLIDHAPHDWLFPQMRAVVHHGGAGSTAAGLRAGVPSIVVPHFNDQPLWGARVHALGVGPRPIPRDKLTPRRLAEAIRQAASDTAMQSKAAALGQRIRAEDGVGAAVALIDRLAFR